VQPLITSSSPTIFPGPRRQSYKKLENHYYGTYSNDFHCFEALKPGEISAELLITLRTILNVHPLLLWFVERAFID
jgi:hypothetical protein